MEVITASLGALIEVALEKLEALQLLHGGPVAVVQSQELTQPVPPAGDADPVRDCLIMWLQLLARDRPPLEFRLGERKRGTTPDVGLAAEHVDLEEARLVPNRVAGDGVSEEGLARGIVHCLRLDVRVETGVEAREIHRPRVIRGIEVEVSIGAEQRDIGFDARGLEAAQHSDGRGSSSNDRDLEGSQGFYLFMK